MVEVDEDSLRRFEGGAVKVGSLSCKRPYRTQDNMNQASVKPKDRSDKFDRWGRLTSRSSNNPSENVLSSARHESTISFVSGEAFDICARRSSG